MVEKNFIVLLKFIFYLFKIIWLILCLKKYGSFMVFWRLKNRLVDFFI